MNFLLRLVVLVLALGGGADAAELQFPPGSRIGLVPLPGMTVSTSFQGFQGKAGAILSVTELTGHSYARVAQEFSLEAIKASGMEFVSREELALPGGPAIIAATRHEISGVTMRKWALAALFGDVTIVVVMTMPEDSRWTYPDAVVRAMFNTVSVRPKLSQDQLLAVLPYRLADLGGFHVMRATPNGHAVLTLGADDTPLPVEQPYFMVVGYSLNVPAASHENFARTLIAQFNAGGAEYAGPEPLRIGGAPGNQIIIERKDERTGDMLVTIQWMRFAPSGYVQMVGIARKDQWPDALPRMRAIRDGFGDK